jgi:hypothetical protein
VAAAGASRKWRRRHLGWLAAAKCSWRNQQRRKMAEENIGAKAAAIIEMSDPENNRIG